MEKIKFVAPSKLYHYDVQSNKVLELKYAFKDSDLLNYHYFCDEDEYWVSEWNIVFNKDNIDNSLCSNEELYFTIKNRCVGFVETFLKQKISEIQNQIDVLTKEKELYLLNLLNV